jgi:hypothetical protein
VNRFLQILRLRLAAIVARRPPADRDPHAAIVRDLASDFAVMGPAARGDEQNSSPGAERLLATARLEANERFAPLIGTISRGIAGSSAGHLRATFAREIVDDAQRELDRTEERVRDHAARRPAAPRVVNRIAAHPATRLGIAALCVVVEMLITAPAFAVLDHGDFVLGLWPLKDVLAVVVGLFVFAAAEVAAELFATWLNGTPPARGVLARLRRRRRPAVRAARRAAGRGGHPPYQRVQVAAAVGCALICAATLGTLAWLISVRDENVRAARAIEASGAATALPLPGVAGLGGAVPGTTGPGASTPASPPGAGGPIAGLGPAGPGAAPGATPAAPGGPIAFGPAPAGPPARPGTDEGDLGPVGALSLAAFVLAFGAAALANTTTEFRDWRAKARRLRKAADDARAARSAAERGRGSADVATPLHSVGYDVAARQVAQIANDTVERARLW